MKDIIKQLTRIADALEKQAENFSAIDSGKHKERHRKRLRLLLMAETDKRFPNLAEEIRSERFREIPLDESVIEWLTDECGDPTAVLNYLVSNSRVAKVLATMEPADAHRELKNIDLKLVAREAKTANTMLSALLDKKGETE